jgi:hypothetical protein
VLVRSNPLAAAGLTAKLADFGLSRAMKQHQTHRTTMTCGTMSHMVSAEGCITAKKVSSVQSMRRQCAAANAAASLLHATLHLSHNALLLLPPLLLQPPEVLKEGRMSPAMDVYGEKGWHCSREHEHAQKGKDT